jgi:hypothetical protein
MLAEHPIFEHPTDPNVLIWRYLDFTKFLDLLETKTLFFPRADRFEDRFEGSYPRMNVVSRPEVFLERGFSPTVAKELAASMPTLAKAMRRYTAISCWHMNPFESVAMWRLYLKNNEGIAIQPNYSRLVQQFLPLKEEIYAGVVRYIDYEKDHISDEHTTFDSFIFKRKSFEHEMELRALIQRPPPTTSDRKWRLDVDVIKEGIRVPVNLESLLGSIHVAPGSPSWFVELVKSVTARYAVNVPVVQSSLETDPMY